MNAPHVITAQQAAFIALWQQRPRSLSAAEEVEISYSFAEIVVAAASGQRVFEFGDSAEWSEAARGLFARLAYALGYRVDDPSAPEAPKPAALVVRF